MGVLSLAACEDERPPRWERACVESEAVVRVVPALTPEGQVTTATVVEQRCVRREWVCRVGADYAGGMTCDDLGPLPERAEGCRGVAEPRKG